MEVFYSYLIPLAGVLFMLIFHRDRLVWWELLLPFLVCTVFIFGFKLSVEKALTSDVEYRGSLITHARYYEPYETYVKRTCTRTYKCGKATCTSHYDCSYCDYTGPKYYVYDDLGGQYTISRAYYRELVSRWHATENFIELNRSINYHLGCGKDGDAYQINWDNDPLTSDAAVNTAYYENRVQASHSVFSYPEISSEEARKLGLYDYPKFYGEFDAQQKCFLGLDSVTTYTKGNKIWVDKEFEFFNGFYGPRKHIKVFVLLFFDRPIETAFKQEAYWDGGNDNELIICIGLDRKTHELDWVKPFSWTPNKRLLVELRDRIMDQRYLSPKSIIEELTYCLRYWKRKDFKEFDYLTVDIPAWQIVVSVVATAFITFFCCAWSIHNEFE